MEQLLELGASGRTQLTMLLDETTVLSEGEIDALLGRNETGVVSLARGDTPYAVPISYGYDAEERIFYLRLVSNPESEKRSFLSSSVDARLVVYEADEPTYSSVVVTGVLEEIDRDDLTVEDLEQYGAAKRPLFELWGESLPDLYVRLYRLVPAELSGRRAVMESDVRSS